jgi:hypothetical protein
MSMIRNVLMVLAGSLCLWGTPESALAGDDDLAPWFGNAEIQRLVDEDQEDRAGQVIDWKAVGARDSQRLARTRAVLAADSLRSAQDLFNAALILQHGSRPEDYLLAHDLCVAGLARVGGRQELIPSLAWLAAASEDRWLWSIGRKQRFGTQMRPNTPVEVDGEVTDALRLMYNCPTLEAARKQAAEFEAAEKR